MKRIAIAFVAAGLFLGMSSTAVADNGDTDIQFIDISPHIVDGELVVPHLYDYRAQNRAQFDALHTMDTSFIDKIVESSAAIN